MSFAVCAMPVKELINFYIDNVTVIVMVKLSR